MLTKTKLKEQLEDFPEHFSLDELIDKLILIEKIETGNAQVKNGELVTETELDTEIEKWFK